MEATQAGQTRALAVASDLYFHDRCRSREGPRLQATLRDGAQLTLGENATLVIDEFVYEPHVSRGEFLVRIAKGAFLLSVDNFLNIGRQTTLVSIVAVGMTFVIIAGQIDLSVASTLALSGMAAPLAMAHVANFWIVGASMISADSQGNGQIAAQILASCVDKGGTIGLVNFGVDYFSTNERTKGVRECMQKNRPDIKMKQVDFTDPAKVSQIAGDFLTANPDVKGVFAVWDQPALNSLSSMRAQNINIPVTTVDLGLQSAI